MRLERRMQRTINYSLADQAQDELERQVSTPKFFEEWIMGREAGRTLILKQLEKEFSVENYLVVQNVHRVSACTTEAERTLNFCNIYKRFIASDSPQCINIPHRVHVPLRLKYQAIMEAVDSKDNNISSNDRFVERTILDNAKDEIIHLIFSDSYVRLRMDEKFTTYIGTIKVHLESERDGDKVMRKNPEHSDFSEPVNSQQTSKFLELQERTQSTTSESLCISNGQNTSHRSPEPADLDEAHEDMVLSTLSATSLYQPDSP